MFGIAQHEHRVIQSLPEGVRKLVDTALALAILIAESNPSLLESMADHLITIERGEAQIQS